MSSSLRIPIVAAILLLAPTSSPAFDWQIPATLVELAQEGDPSLAAARAELSAARERLTYVGAQPNPMLMSGIQNLPLTGGNDEMMTMYMVGASQTFVRPARRSLAVTAVEAEVDAIELRIESLRAEIERDVLASWLQIAATDNQRVATSEMKEVLAAMSDTARIRYEVGAVAQADLIRAQFATSEIERELIRLEGRRRASSAGLLPMLGLQADIEIPPVATFETMTSLHVPEAQPDLASHPLLAGLEAEVQRLELGVQLAELETRPDFGVQASYGYRASQPDMISVVATVELPLRRSSVIEPRIREAVALRSAAESRIEAARRSLHQALGEARARHEEADRQLRLYEQVLLHQAQMALDSSLAAYQSGTTSFDAVLATQNQLLRLRLDHAALLEARARAAIDYRAIQRGARAAGTSMNAVSSGALARPASSGRAMSGMGE